VESLTSDPRYFAKSYSFELPEALIAQRPAEPRDQSRLMVLDRSTSSIHHDTFANIGTYLRAGDLLVANNSKVMKARLLGHRIVDGQRTGKVEALLLEKKRSSHVWEALMRASAKMRVGFEFDVAGKLRGKVLEAPYDESSGSVLIEFSEDPLAGDLGVLPLPPYIATQPTAETDRHYQTIYAKSVGSAAAPTAGLHFTSEKIQELEAKGIRWQELTLHVGVGTFRPVRSADIREHQMHEEWFRVSETLASELNDLKRVAQGRLVAVGTTSLRALESSVQDGKWSAGENRTQIFFHPGGKAPKVVDGLLTNFHLPQSTLLMLVCAFAGTEFTLRAYKEAVDRKYRFFSYGDAMLIV